MAASKVEIEDVPCCPICLEQFNIPRQLPCAHSFCEKCLQSHITTEVRKHSKLCFVKCPVCRNSARPSIKDKPTSEWASLFPANTVLQSVLTESKVNRLCDACSTEADAVPAEGLCVFCKEAMCRDCLKLHRRQKISKDHMIISLEELVSKPENAVKLVEDFTCSEHNGEDIKFYCKNHKVPCCGMCFVEGHKTCSTVIDLKKELLSLLCDSKPNKTIADMKKIEIHLKKFMEVNKAFVTTLKPQVDRLTKKVRDVRQKINAVLDQLETLVEAEGNRIYKEEVTRIQDENHQCLSLIHAVRNSCYLLEAVNKYGSNLQKFIMSEKMSWQLQSYCNLVGEKYEKTDTVLLQVKFAPPIQSLLSLTLSALGKVVTTASSNTMTCSWKPRKFTQVEVISLKYLTFDRQFERRYIGVTCLPGDRVMLADYIDNQCILLNSSYRVITSHTLTGKPCDICVLDDQEVAVSLYDENKIQILSVIGDVIRRVKMITTKYSCNGIAAAGNGDMVVNGYCGNNKSQWSLINMKGDVKCTHQYDSVDGDSRVILNDKKTLVYISLSKTNSLLCFDMDGKKLFTYSPDNLQNPFGVAVDRYDNIYVLGNSSNNIHQLEPDGSVQQVVNTGVPTYPRAICIHKSKDILIIMNDSDETKLYIYQLK
ncbi:hypothetical protein CHS0354_014379 [Potamilus streckersoni]|uniref:RING-type domain-containing protein n=1 Tax=Potamilus streckersoni TaxID=2493646 RepID=A0AAE0T6H8_9BIVA|nr:hypothetical protein CHS0354_014379 [Potamilus streckersoni]